MLKKHKEISLLFINPYSVAHFCLLPKKCHNLGKGLSKRVRIWVAQFMSLWRHNDILYMISFSPSEANLWSQMYVKFMPDKVKRFFSTVVHIMDLNKLILVMVVWFKVNPQVFLIREFLWRIKIRGYSNNTLGGGMGSTQCQTCFIYFLKRCF